MHEQIRKTLHALIEVNPSIEEPHDFYIEANGYLCKIISEKSLFKAYYWLLAVKLKPRDLVASNSYCLELTPNSSLSYNLMKIIEKHVEAKDRQDSIAQVRKKSIALIQDILNRFDIFNDEGIIQYSTEWHPLFELSLKDLLAELGLDIYKRSDNVEVNL